MKIVVDRREGKGSWVEVVGDSEVRIVDIHSHVIPPSLVAMMERGSAPDAISLEDDGERKWVVHRQGYRYPLLREFYDVEARLNAMDADGIDQAVLSPAPPLFLYWIDAEAGIDASRVINDSMAEMSSEEPSRFIAIGTLPLQAPREAVAELRRCVKDLGLRGALIGPHCEGVDLDDPSLRPVLAAAEELGVPLVVHPYYVGSVKGLDDFYLTNLQGNPFQTAVCASRLILSGTLDELDELTIVLVHGGGHLLYQIGRLDHGYRVRPEAGEPANPPSTYLRRFYYDSLTHREESTAWLVDQVGADRVLFGTDFPFDMGGPSFSRQFSGCEIDPNQRSLVASQNATRIFGSIGGVG